MSLEEPPTPNSILVAPLTANLFGATGLQSQLDAHLNASVVGFMQGGKAIGTGLLAAYGNSDVVLTVGHIGLEAALHSKEGVALFLQSLPMSNLRIGTATRVIERYAPSEREYWDAGVMWLDPREAAMIKSWGARPLPFVEPMRPVFEGGPYIVTGFPDSLVEIEVQPERRRLAVTPRRLNLWLDLHSTQRDDGSVALQLGPLPPVATTAAGDPQVLTLPGMSGAPVWTGYGEVQARRAHLQLAGFHSASNADTAIFVPKTQHLEVLKANS
jgi:hypothetical protein